MPESQAPTSMGTVRIQIHNLRVQPPPPEFETLLRASYQSLSTPKLLWLLTAITDEIKTRGVDIHVTPN